MSRVAIIGSGISGLAAAYYLSRKHEVYLFEKDGRLGGHTHTVTVESSRGTIPVDTGFIVHNDRTYPNLVRLLAELGVETQPSDMSFAVTCRTSGFEYSSRGVNGFFAQRANLLRIVDAIEPGIGAQNAFHTGIDVAQGPQMELLDPAALPVHDRQFVKDSGFELDRGGRINGPSCQ